MLIDARELSTGARLEATVCVIGAGAAGITLARRLDALGVATLLLESGGFEPDDEVQALARGSTDSYHPLDTTRLRYLGGTTNHFAGQSRPLEEIDFSTMPWHRDGGWPLPREVALARLPEAVEVLGLAGDEWRSDTLLGERAADALLPGDEIDLTLFQGAAIRMGAVYRPELVASERVRLVLHANARRLRLAEGGAVDHLEVSTLGGAALTASARVFVVATGGIDVPRLLLDSNDEAPAGVGNGHDLVGRYFADHPNLFFVPVAVAGDAATTPRPRSRTLSSAVPELDVVVSELLAPTASAQQVHELPGFNATLFLDGQPWSVPSVPHDEAVADAVADLVALPGAGSEPPARRSLALSWEQVPNPESRVTLLRERNAVGERRVRVDWRLTDDDERTARRALMLIARYLAGHGLGTVLTEPRSGRWLDVMEGAHHHLGTARMADSPRAGVVDRDLRVHGVANLYVASSAVFPTYGHVNPTLNLVALTLRLAEHLAQQVGS